MTSLVSRSMFGVGIPRPLVAPIGPRSPQPVASVAECPKTYDQWVSHQVLRTQV